MALYHCSVKSVGGAKSGARASASSWCDYVQREAQYGNKDALLCSGVLLPPNAPPEFADPHVLWASVDAAESRADARTGREFEVALPRELTLAQQRELVEEWAQSELVTRGMCAHYAIHESRDGENPHAHITATVRPLDERGEWAKKYTTAYPVRRGGVERTIPAAEWKAAKADGWEKVYPFKNGDALTKTEAAAAGLSWKDDRRGSKPLSVTEHTTDWDGWGDGAAVERWRESWAAAVNRSLGRHAPETERVDHRSYERRAADPTSELYGLELEPTQHLGSHANGALNREQRAEREAENAAAMERNAERLTLRDRIREAWANLQDRARRVWEQVRQKPDIPALAREYREKARAEQQRGPLRAKEADLSQELRLFDAANAARMEASTRTLSPHDEMELRNETERAHSRCDELEPIVDRLEAAYSDAKAEADRFHLFGGKTAQNALQEAEKRLKAAKENLEREYDKLADLQERREAHDEAKRDYSRATLKYNYACERMEDRLAQLSRPDRERALARLAEESPAAWRALRDREPVRPQVRERSRGHDYGMER